MIRFTLFVSLVALAEGLPTYSVDYSRIDLNGDWRIVGGSAAPDGEYPFIVSLRTSVNIHFCGGSILNTDWILTAAHCLVGATPANTHVVAGTNTLNEGGVSIAAIKFTLHADFDINFTPNDIGVIQLSQALTFTGIVAPVSLNTAATGVVPAILVGWGRTYTDSDFPNALQHLDTYTITTAECQLFWGSVTDSNICALLAAGRGSCHGDSGGPLIRASSREQIGIVSYAHVSGCAIGFPDVYTRISAYTSWISNAISS